MKSPSCRHTGTSACRVREVCSSRLRPGNSEGEDRVRKGGRGEKERREMRMWEREKGKREGKRRERSRGGEKREEEPIEGKG